MVSKTEVRTAVRRLLDTFAADVRRQMAEWVQGNQCDQCDRAAVAAEVERLLAEKIAAAEGKMVDALWQAATAGVEPAEI